MRIETTELFSNNLKGYKYDQNVLQKWLTMLTIQSAFSNTCKQNTKTRKGSSSKTLYHIVIKERRRVWKRDNKVKEYWEMQ